ncbi:hypothetical protein ACW0TR_08725 [Fusobacterium polymorphum]
MSKYYELVCNVNKLKKNLELIQEEIIEEKNTENLNTILNEKISSLKDEIILVNSKREELWKSIRDIQDFLFELEIINKKQMNYDTYIREKIKEPNTKKEIELINRILIKLEPDTKKNEQEFCNDYEGVLNTLLNRIRKPIDTTKEERKIEALYRAQLRQYTYLKFYFERYKDSLKLQIPYYEECERVAKLYRNSLNTLIDTIEKKIFPSLDIVKFFLKTLSIKELVEKNKINENMALKDIPIKKGIASLKNSKYNIFYIFFENLSHLYTSIISAFKEITLTDLMALKYEECEKQELEKLQNEIENLIQTTSDIGTLDMVWKIDSTDEYLQYSILDIKFLNYIKPIEKNSEKIKVIEVKTIELNQNLKNIKEVINEII